MTTNRELMNRKFSSGFVLPSPMILMAGAIAVLIITNFFTLKLYQGKVDEHARYVAEVDAANAKVKSDNEAYVARLKQQAKDIQSRYDRDVGAIRTDYVSRLRNANRRCSTLSGAAATARLTYEATSDPRLGAAGQASEFEQACIKLETDAAVTTLQLLYLQDWAGKLK